MSGLSVYWLILFVDASLKSVLLALIAATGLTVLRVRDSNLQHRVWAGVLGGMLMLPLLTQVVPAWRLPIHFRPDSPVVSNSHAVSIVPEVNPERPTLGITVTADPSAQIPSATDQQPVAIENVPTMTANDRQQSSGDDDPRTVESLQSELSEDTLRSQPSPEEAPASDPQTATTPSATVQLEDTDGGDFRKESRPESPTLSQSFLAHLPLVLSSVWFCGMLLFSARLLVGLGTAQLLKRASRPIENVEVSDISHRVPVLECPLIRVPITLGAIRSRILLPAEWIEWSDEKLHSVLVHERTHAERGDCLLALVAELNRCVYWFHPLAWWIRQRLASLAEAACDDAAIDSIGDRVTYARHLLEVAATARAHRGRLVSGSVSMARRSGVESRIISILDFTRPLSQRLTSGTTLLLAVILIPSIALTAALRPSNATEEVVVSDSNPVQREDEAPSLVQRGERPTQASTGDVEEDPFNDDSEDPKFTYAGTVIDPAGKPVAGAKIYLCYGSRFLPQNQRVQATSAVDGTFRFSKRASDFDRFGETAGSWKQAGIVATSEGLGFAAGNSVDFETTGRLRSLLTDPKSKKRNSEEQKQTTSILKLTVDDVPIRMRIVDLEGQPVTGVKLQVLKIWQPRNGSLTDWELQPFKPLSNSELNSLLEGPSATVVISAIRPEAGGWNLISGLGRERLAEVQMTAPGVEAAVFHVRTRRGETFHLPEARRLRPVSGDNPAYQYYYPADFTHVVGPSQPVTGRITDIKTGAPISGCIVEGGQVPRVGTVLPGNSRTVWAMTDSSGRYRLDGLHPRPNPDTQTLRVLPPSGSAYLPVSIGVSVGTSHNPVIQDARLYAGVRVRGTVRDSKTGRSVTATLRYTPFSNNPNLESAGFTSQSKRSNDTQKLLVSDFYRSNESGHFEIPVLPGNSVLSLTADDSVLYSEGVGIESVRAAVLAAGADSILPGAGNLPREANLLVHLDLPVATKEIRLDLRLDGRRTIRGSVESPDGQALADYLVYSGFYSGSHWHKWTKAKGPTFDLDVYFPPKQRELLFYHPGHNLVGQFELKPEVTENLKVTLTPAAMITGRVVGNSGEPLADVEIVNADSNAAPLLSGRPSHDPTWGVLADADGRFEIRGIIPGREYSASAISRADGRQKNLGRVFTNVTVEPSRTHVLGNVIPNQAVPNMSDIGTPAPRKVLNADAKPSVAQVASRPFDDAQFVFAGTVVDVAGQPVADAKISLNYFRRNPQATVPIPAAVSNARGEFQFSAKENDFTDAVPHRMWIDARLMATKDGFGFAIGPIWDFETTGRIRAKLSDQRQELERKTDTTGDVLTLIPDDVPIRGRLLNAEGKPVAGATIEVIDVWDGKAGSLDAWDAALHEPAADGQSGYAHIRQLVEGRRMSFHFTANASLVWKRSLNGGDPFAGTRPLAVSKVRSDDGGWFTIVGLGRERIAETLISGPGIETSQILIRSRKGDVITLPFHKQSPGIPYSNQPCEFSFVCGASSPVTGRVTDVKTGQPIAGIGIQPMSLSTNTVSDANGEFRLDGLPIGDTNLFIVPPSGSPYIAGGASVTTTGSLQPVVRNIALTAGVLVRGRATEEATGKPLNGWLEYFAYPSNPYLEGTDSLKQGRIQSPIYSDADGQFEIPILPGPGIVGFWAGEDFQTGVGAETIDCPRNRGGGDSIIFQTVPTYCIANSFQVLTPTNPKPDDNQLTLNLKVHPSLNIPGRVLSPDGESLSNFVINGARRRRPWDPIIGKEFTVRGYLPQETRRLTVVHFERNLAGYYDLSGPPPEKIEMTLRPAGTLTGRVLDAEGEPVARALLSCTGLRNIGPNGNLPPEASGNGVFREVTADAQGRFEIKGMISGLKYSGRSNSLRGLNPLFTDVTVQEGEFKDLGDLEIAPRQRPRMNPQQK